MTRRHAVDGAVLRCAAVQLHAVLGDVDANLAACEIAVRQAASEGARVVALPEFFPSGVAYRLEIAHAAQSIDGPAAQALLSWAKTPDVAVAGSLLVRDPDGHVRNAHLLTCSPGRPGCSAGTTTTSPRGGGTRSTLQGATTGSCGRRCRGAAGTPSRSASGWPCAGS